MTTTRTAAVLALSAVLVLSLTGAAAAPGDSPRLRADLDHDGRVDATADSPAGTAIFLPNLDDSSRRCTVSEADLDRVGDEVDNRLADCNDAADDRVNGDRDAADLARLRLDPVPGLGDSAVGRLRVDAGSTGKVRIFARPGSASGAEAFRAVLPEGSGRLSAAELRGGLEFGVEGRDIVRDPEVWDGRVTVTLSITDGDRRFERRVNLREAPVLLQNDLQAATKVFAAKPGTGPGWPQDLMPIPEELPGHWDRFAKTLRDAGPEPDFIAGTSTWWKDLWWQDIFEPTTVSMPAAHGTRTMRILVRSGNQFGLPDSDGKSRLTPRPFARQLFKELRGPGVGVVQQFSDEDRDYLTDLRNATGNIESLPPYRVGDQEYPQGRIVYGTGDERAPDRRFLRLLSSMGQGYQPPVEIDTDWLMVGHADETFHVVKADNDRGWTLMVADPRLAVDLLERARDAGGGGAKLFTGTDAPEKPSVGEVLANRKLLSDNETAAGHIDDQVSDLVAATGLRESDLVRAPVLFTKDETTGSLFRAYTSGIPNGLSVDADHFAAPDPHGPVLDGRDVFRQATAEALRRNGVAVSWVEDYSWAHLLGGEAHCATNAYRDVSGAPPWWRD